MTWFMKILKVKQDEQTLIKYCLMKYLILLKIQTVIEINVNLVHQSTNSLIKKSALLAHSETLRSKTLAMRDKSSSGGAIEK